MMVDFNRTKTVNRPRRQAMITIATALIGWVTVYQVGIQWMSRSSSKLDQPPQFFVDLETASEEELQLLPDIGRKTAHAWRQALDDSPSLSPRIAKELEVLPHVGPIRSSKLAPFLVESEVRSTSSLDPSIETTRPSANP